MIEFISIISIVDSILRTIPRTGFEYHDDRNPIIEKFRKSQHDVLDYHLRLKLAAKSLKELIDPASAYYDHQKPEWFLLSDEGYPINDLSLEKDILAYLSSCIKEYQNRRTTPLPDMLNYA